MIEIPTDGDLFSLNLEIESDIRTEFSKDIPITRNIPLDIYPLRSRVKIRTPNDKLDAKED